MVGFYYEGPNDLVDTNKWRWSIGFSVKKELQKEIDPLMSKNGYKLASLPSTAAIKTTHPY